MNAICLMSLNEEPHQSSQKNGLSLKSV